MLTYSHYMHLAATLRPGVTKEQLRPSLLRLADYLGWSDEQIFDNFETGHELIEWIQDDKAGTLKLYLQTNGQVDDDYYELLEVVADEMHDLVHATYFRLVNMDEAVPEEAGSKIWIGSGEELELAQRESVVNEVAQLLYGTITDEAMRNDILDQIQSAPLPSLPSNQPSNRRIYQQT